MDNGVGILFGVLVERRLSGLETDSLENESGAGSVVINVRVSMEGSEGEGLPGMLLQLLLLWLSKYCDKLGRDLTYWRFELLLPLEDMRAYAACAWAVEEVFVVVVVVVAVAAADDDGDEDDAAAGMLASSKEAEGPAADLCMFSSSFDAADASTFMKSGRYCWCGGWVASDRWCWTLLSSFGSLRNFEDSCCCCFCILCFLANFVAEVDFFKPADVLLVLFEVGVLLLVLVLLLLPLLLR